MKLFLTGGTGFIGRSLLRHWLDKRDLNSLQFSVLVMSRRPDEFLRSFPVFKNHAWLQFCKGDIADITSFPVDADIDAIIHAAADSTFGHRLQPIDRFAQIFDGTRNVLNFAVQKNTRRFLYLSSGAVYGEQNESASGIAESVLTFPDPLQHWNVYGVAKRSAEHLCALYQEAYDIDIVIARCFSFLGQDLPLDVHYAIGNFMRNALDRTDIVINSDGSSIRSYLDQRDLARWLDLLLWHGRRGHAYNLGSPFPIRIMELAYRIRNLIAPQSSVVFLNAGHNQRSRSFYAPDISKIQSDLDVKVEIDLDQSIIDTANYLSS